MSVAKVTVEHARQLRRLFVETARGEITHVRLNMLGPLAAVASDGRGWRFDAICHVRAVLQAGLSAYAEEGSERYYGGVGRTDVAEMLRLTWGIESYPKSARRAVELRPPPDAKRLPDADSVQRWSDQVITSAAFIDRLQSTVDKTAARLDVGRGTTSDPQAWTSDPMTWPPPTRAEGEDERTMILRRARQSLLSVESSLTLDDDELIQCLRQEVSDYLERTYFADDSDSRLYRHVSARLSDPWFHADILSMRAPSPPFQAPRKTHRIQRAVATAAQWVFHDLAASRYAHVGKLSMRIRERASVVDAGDLLLFGIRNGRSISGATARVEELPTGGVLRELLRPQHAGPVLVPARSLGTFHNGDGPFEASAAIELANRIRSEPPDLKQDLAVGYVQRRLRSLHRPASADDRILFQLADLSVQLDLVSIRDTESLRQLSALIRSENDSPQGLAYSTLVWRNESLLNNKVKKFQRAIHQLLQGYRELKYKIDERLIPDDKSARESSHQLALAATGIYIKLIEANLLVRHHLDAHAWLPTYAAAALWWSSEASADLARLDSPSVEPLATTRYADLHISSVNWRVQTRVIRLRAMLGVYTAIGSRLIQLPRSARHLSIELPDLRAAYRQLISTPELQSGSRPDVVNLALWIALLDCGEVPVAADLAPAMKVVRFLDMEPVEIEERALETREVDFSAATNWLIKTDSNAGLLHWLPRNGPVWRYLDVASSHRYSEWVAG